jgi:acid stress-induced BolA-like protein IbaG/YrbA
MTMNLLPINAAQLQQIIHQAMPEAEVHVESADNVHFSARVISAQFVGCSRLQRHRMIHAALQAELGEALGREIHALTLDLKTPEEGS